MRKNLEVGNESWKAAVAFRFETLFIFIFEIMHVNVASPRLSQHLTPNPYLIPKKDVG